MQSVRLSGTGRRDLEKKYPAAALKQIDKAVAAWTKADKERDIQTVHVAVDDAAAMKKLGVKAVTGAITPNKVKRALDALVARLTPDYIVLLGAADVVPTFLVANPSASESGDDDEEVPTDNPYACSRQFVASRRSSYLVPDRVVGRIPDLPGSTDPSWLVDYLAHVAQARPRPMADYDRDLMICTASWRKAGEECAKTLGRKPADVLISPPTKDKAPAIVARRNARLHMIKCHGVDEDSRFYGEGGGAFPDALSSPTLLGRTVPDTVAGAMCCYGADLFDPASPTAQHPPEFPIPSVYLKQGAHGFLGSSTIAWVGPVRMMCADWIVTAFLKSATTGASLGRAALEAKQDYLRWLQQQGQEPDAADEKTLIQFLLLGDPSIHPVPSAASATGRARRAGREPAAAGLAAAVPAALQRQRRRAARFEIGGLLRESLPERHVTSPKKAPKTVADEARRAAAAVSTAQMRWTLGRADRVVTTAVAPELAPRAAASIAGQPGLRATRSVAARQTYQYYWISRQRTDRVKRISMVTVQADSRGRVLGSRVVVSS